MITVTLRNGSTAQFPDHAQALHTLQSELSAAVKRINQLESDLPYLNPSEPCPTAPLPSPP